MTKNNSEGGSGASSQAKQTAHSKQTCLEQAQYECQPIPDSSLVTWLYLGARQTGR